MNKLIILSFILVLIGACNKVVLEDTPNYTKHYVVPPIDILFVVDNSNSMAGKIKSVSNQITSLITAFTDDDTFAYTIGITTTDVDYQGQTEMAGISNGALRGDVITSSLSRTDIVSKLQTQLTSIANDTASAKSVEQGLEAAVKAVYKGAQHIGLNGSWYGADHDLAVIIVTDEDDSSNAHSQNICVDLNNCVNWFYKAKASATSTPRISFNIIGDIYKQCIPTNSNGTYDPNVIKPGAHDYLQVINATHGVADSICTNSYTSVLSTIGRNLRANYPLGEMKAELKTLTVKVNNQMQYLGTDYEYDEVNNAVVFHNGHYPKPGDTVEMSYRMKK